MDLRSHGSHCDAIIQMADAWSEHWHKTPADLSEKSKLSIARMGAGLTVAFTQNVYTFTHIQIYIVVQALQYDSFKKDFDLCVG